ncbi:MAG: glycosidase [Actinobacteria bacterium]|nr:glycosidase [Actinomycetota bacterium]MSZ96118.1 glycosidase [Actinomycetota bacterium]
MAVRTESLLRPDSGRVISRLFVPGQEDFGSNQARTDQVIERLLHLEESEVCRELQELTERFGSRHKHLYEVFEMNAQKVSGRVDTDERLSLERWRLLGALFTHEYSIEGASVTNPSAVMHPDQSGLAEGFARFVMSVRGIGEGHRSSIGFRVGTISQEGEIAFDPPGVYPVTGHHFETLLCKEDFIGLQEAEGGLGENARHLLAGMGARFTVAEFHDALMKFSRERDSFLYADVTVRQFRLVAERNYIVTFPIDTEISERVLWPNSTAEWRGMEDARFVRFEDETGVRYLATYTAFDGLEISQQLLSTSDFVTFESHPISGFAAVGKGLAIFPRKIGGRYAAMSRADHETNFVSYSDSLTHWTDATPVQVPNKSWELIQMGNCGSPIETDSGWLLFTHAVGPMRTYCISALLLNLEDPTIVIGSLKDALLCPTEAERDGYTPNVLYSCGSFQMGKHVMIPYGIADQSIGIALVHIDDLVSSLIAQHQDSGSVITDDTASIKRNGASNTY